MWVFGYGSLMWDGWEQALGGQRADGAVLPDYRRSFNKKSTRNWGRRRRLDLRLGWSAPRAGHAPERRSGFQTISDPR
jgi:cation transport regulator ChaC